MSRLWQSFLELIRNIGNYSGCHQLPERSFFINGKQFPVCTRCTGVFIGQIIAIISLILKFFVNNKIAIFFLSLMGIDWLVQATGIKQSTNKRRFITGILGGFGLFILYINFARGAIKYLKSTNL